jgi:hypothetical protein
MARTMLSRPMAIAYDDGVVTSDTAVFDYGCGRGDDIRQLRKLGVRAGGWDPKHRPGASKASGDVVNLGYVINVIEDVHERRQVLREAWSLAGQALVVAARPSWEGRDLRGANHGDGVLTGKGTFQKFYEQDELRAFIESALAERAVAAAPGIFYVFRDSQMAQSVLARRARRAAVGRVLRVSDVMYELHRDSLVALVSFVAEQRRLPTPGELDSDVERGLVDELGSLRAAFALVRRATGANRWSDIDLGRPSQSERRFDRYRELLEPLMQFLERRGRLPRAGELESGEAIEREFGSFRAAFSLVRRVSGSERWVLFEDRARRDLLVYLALAAFGGRPRFSELPDDLQYDVRDLFGSYKTATTEADRLLFGAGDMASVDAAARASCIGKATPEAMYVHVTALDDLPPLLRVYEGCGQALSGTIEGATIVKLHRQKPQVSYLSYPSFDVDPHPELATVVIARLGSLDITFRDFRDSENPPILHRKETFVSPSYPGRAKFARLTAQEERYELLDSATIGTRDGWMHRLSASGVELRGHRVVHRRDVNPRSDLGRVEERTR